MYFETSVPPQKCSVKMFRQLEAAKNWCSTKIQLNNSKAYSEPTQTSKIELFSKIVNDIQQKSPSQMFD